MLEFPGQDFKQELLKVSKYEQLRNFCLRKKRHKREPNFRTKKYRWNKLNIKINKGRDDRKS